MTIKIIQEYSMIDIQKIIPVTKAKKELLDIIKQMVEDDSTVTVTKNGVAVGVLMTPDRYEGLMETIEILGDPKTMKTLAASRRDFQAGRTHVHDEVWRDG
jgi:prevent-host-death family protein